MIAGEVGDTSGLGSAVGEGCLFGPGSLSAGNRAITVARAFSQLGAAISITSYGLGRATSGNGDQFVFPSPIDSGYLVNPKLLLTEVVPGGIAVRGSVPGSIEILGKYAIDHHEVLTGLVGLPGRRMLGLRPFQQGAARVGFDITGPWS